MWPMDILYFLFYNLSLKICISLSHINAPSVFGIVMTESVNDGGDTASHITDQQPQVCCGHQESVLCLGSGYGDTEHRAAGCPDYR